MKRDWTLAILKLTEEDNRCRVCGSRRAVQLAHVTGRTHDRKPSLSDLHCVDGVYPVAPARIVPLCKTHHDLYDAHDFDLLPYLTTVEVLQAVADCAAGRANGLELAHQRLTGEKGRGQAAATS